MTIINCTWTFTTTVKWLDPPYPLFDPLCIKTEIYFGLNLFSPSLFLLTGGYSVFRPLSRLPLLGPAYSTSHSFLPACYTTKDYLHNPTVLLVTLFDPYRSLTHTQTQTESVHRWICQPQGIFAFGSITAILLFPHNILLLWPGLRLKGKGSLMIEVREEHS